MSIKLDTFIRKPFKVQAIQITDENIYEVAKWCRGDVRTTTVNNETKKYIHPRAKYRPLAFVSDWVSFANNGFKIYNKDAFTSNFEPESVDTLK